MGHQWLVLVLLVILIERIYPEPSSESEEYPLTRSLGYSTSNLGNLDSRMSQEFMEKYQEMKKASQESFENFAMVREEKRRRRVIGDLELEQMNGGNEPRNRRRISSNKLQSAVSRRRARLQAHRREKLNSQSVRSHIHHSKQSNMEYINDYSSE